MSVLAQFSQANQTTNPSKSISDTFLYIKTMMTDTNGNSAKEIERYSKCFLKGFFLHIIRQI